MNVRALTNPWMDESQPSPICNSRKLKGFFFCNEIYSTLAFDLFPKQVLSLSG